MGRDSKVKKGLKKRVFKFLLERENCAEKLDICRNQVDYLLNATSSDRRKQYKLGLTTMLENLCSDSCDLLEYKTKYAEIKNKYATVQEKKCKLQDELQDKERQLKKMLILKNKCDKHEQAREKAENDLNDIVSENEFLLKKIEILKQKMAS